MARQVGPDLLLPFLNPFKHSSLLQHQRSSRRQSFVIKSLLSTILPSSILPLCSHGLAVLHTRTPRLELNGEFE